MGNLHNCIAIDVQAKYLRSSEVYNCYGINSYHSRRSEGKVTLKKKPKQTAKVKESPRISGKQEQLYNVMSDRFKIIIPLAFFLLCLILRLLLLRQGFDQQDAYREALSGMKYVTEGIVGGYGWNDPLNVHLTAFAYRISEMTQIEHETMCNLISAVLASFGVIAFYFFAKNLTNLRTSILITVALIFSPFHIEHSVYFIHGNIELAFFLLSLFLLHTALTKKRSDKTRKIFWMYILFGIGFGLQVSSRVISGILVLPLFVYMCVYYRKNNTLKDFLQLATFFLVSFVLTCVLFFPPQIVKDILTAGGTVVGEYNVSSNFYSAIVLVFFNTISKLLLIVCAASLVYLIWKKKYNIVVLSVIIVLSYCAFYAGLPGVPSLYFLCTLPFILLSICYCGDLILSRGGSPSSKGDKKRRKEEVKRHGLFADDHVNPVAFLIIMVIITVMPWFGRTYKGLWSRMVFHSKNNTYRIISERIGRDVGNDMVLVYYDEPMIQYYNYRNPPETFYVLKRSDVGEVDIPREKLADAMTRIETGQDVYITTYAVNILKHSRVKFDLKELWQFANYSLYKIHKIYLE